MQTLCNWVNRYNAVGSLGLHYRPRNGRPSKLTETQQKTVVFWVTEGTPDGEPDWKLKSLQLNVKKEFGVSFSLEGVRRLLIRLGLRYITPRPHHNKVDFEGQQQFGDASSISTLNILPDSLDLELV